MLEGPEWLINHPGNGGRPGNTKEGRAYTKRIREESPVLVRVCDDCESKKEFSSLGEIRWCLSTCKAHESLYGRHLCPSCGLKEGGRKGSRTKSEPQWKELHPQGPSWQSRSSAEKLEKWVSNRRSTHLKTISEMSKEERSAGVRKQWASMTPEAKARRALKISESSRRMWAEYEPEARLAHIQKMITRTPRSRASESFKAFLMEAGLYEGFESEVLVSGFVVDECNLERKLVIEFFGDYFHCNPRNPRFNRPDWVNTTIRMTAEECWKRDRRRIAAIRKAGFRVLVVWEGDWDRDPEDVVSSVKLFLGRVPPNK